MQRVEGLRLVEPVGGDVTLAQRRHPQVNKGLSQIFAAQAAYALRWHWILRFDALSRHDK